MINNRCNIEETRLKQTLSLLKKFTSFYIFCMEKLCSDCFRPFALKVIAETLEISATLMNHIRRIQKSNNMGVSPKNLLKSNEQNPKLISVSHISFLSAKNHVFQIFPIETKGHETANSPKNMRGVPTLKPTSSKKTFIEPIAR